MHVQIVKMLESWLCITIDGVIFYNAMFASLHRALCLVPDCLCCLAFDKDHRHWLYSTNRSGTRLGSHNDSCFAVWGVAQAKTWLVLALDARDVELDPLAYACQKATAVIVVNCITILAESFTGRLGISCIWWYTVPVKSLDTYSFQDFSLFLLFSTM